MSCSTAVRGAGEVGRLLARERFVEVEDDAREARPRRKFDRVDVLRGLPLADLCESFRGLEVHAEARAVRRERLGQNLALDFARSAREFWFAFAPDVKSFGSGGPPSASLQPRRGL